MTTKQWEVRVFLPGIIVLLAAMYVAGILFYRHVKTHESKTGTANQPLQRKGE